LAHSSNKSLVFKKKKKSRGGGKKNLVSYSQPENRKKKTKEKKAKRHPSRGDKVKVLWEKKDDGGKNSSRLAVFILTSAKRTQASQDIEKKGIYRRGGGKPICRSEREGKDSMSIWGGGGHQIIAGELSSPRKLG